MNRVQDTPNEEARRLLVAAERAANSASNSQNPDHEMRMEGYAEASVMAQVAQGWAMLALVERNEGGVQRVQVVE